MKNFVGKMYLQIAFHKSKAINKLEGPSINDVILMTVEYVHIHSNLCTMASLGSLNGGGDF